MGLFQFAAGNTGWGCRCCFRKTNHGLDTPWKIYSTSEEGDKAGLDGYQMGRLSRSRSTGSQGETATQQWFYDCKPLCIQAGHWRNTCDTDGPLKGFHCAGDDDGVGYTIDQAHAVKQGIDGVLQTDAPVCKKYPSGVEWFLPIGNAAAVVAMAGQKVVNGLFGLASLR